MEYDKSLIEGIFQRRYKRFFADVLINGEKAVAHVPNTGSLLGICDQGEVPCLLSPATNPERKLRWTLEQLRVKDTWVGVNTQVANTLAWEAFVTKTIPHWREFTDARREVKVSPESRIDLMLTDGKRSHFVEVKSVTLGRDGVALFPDAETTRGQKHLRELMALLESDGRPAGSKRGGSVGLGEDSPVSCEMLYVVQRADCRVFSPAEDIDAEYARLLREAAKAGVTISAFAVTADAHDTVLRPQPLQINLG